MKLAFTICSINYLAQAITLGNSFKQYNKFDRFVIGLVDKPANSSYLNQIPFDIIEVEKIGIHSFDDMSFRYTITELCTAVKPYYIDYFFKQNDALECITYLDPDIRVYNSFDYLYTIYDDHEIVITPHFFNSINDDYHQNESDFLNSGIYNLGFIGVKRGPETFKFIDWWKNRLNIKCYVDFKNGLFVDQLWINFVPLFFKNVCILDHLGYNVAYWNLHERNITINKENGYSINEKYPLIFYHFSGFDLDSPQLISKYQNRFNFFNRPEIVFLFEEYSKNLISNGYHEWKQIDCYYATKRANKIRNENEIKIKQWSINKRIAIRIVKKLIKKYEIVLK